MSTPGQSSILGSPIIYAKVDYGPTLGFVYRPVNNRRLVTAAGNDTVQPFDQMVLYNKTVPASFQVFLPDLNLWMTKPYGGFDLIFIDSASNATTYPITFVPFGSQTIEGSAGNFVMNTDGGSTIFIPATDKSGWTLIQETPGSGGGGGTPHLPFNSVQFNDAGAFGGNAGFLYDRTTALTVNLTNAGITSAGASALITAGDGGATSGNGGVVILNGGSATGVGDGGNIGGTAGNGGATSGAGGIAALQAGDADGGGAGGVAAVQAGAASGTGVGGALSLGAGNADDIGGGGTASVIAGNGGATSGNGGGLNFRSGAARGIGDGGFANILAGDANGTGNGGYVLIEGGDADNGDGGTVSITGGFASANGGNIELIPGVGSSAATSGHVKIDTLQNFADDVAAAAGGVPVTGLYRTASVVKVRVT